MDDFNILENLASRAPDTLILAYGLYRLFKMYLKEKADRISTSKEYTAYLAEQVAARDEVIRNNTKIIAELYKRSTVNTSTHSSGSK
jgi:hypothetical protein